MFENGKFFFGCVLLFFGGEGGWGCNKKKGKFGLYAREGIVLRDDVVWDGIVDEWLVW